MIMMVDKWCNDDDIGNDNNDNNNPKIPKWYEHLNELNFYNNFRIKIKLSESIGLKLPILLIGFL